MTFLWSSDLNWNTIVYCYTVKHKSFPATSDILVDSKLAKDNNYDGKLAAILMPEDISLVDTSQATCYKGITTDKILKGTIKKKIIAYLGNKQLPGDIIMI